jgi:hypothetical protein
MPSRINHLAVLVSAIVFFLLGWLWYDALFGRTWMALTGHVATTAPMTSLLVTGFLLGWVLAYVVGIALSDTTHPNPARHGMEFGIFMGLGVFGSMLALDYLYEGRSFALWAINTGYVVVGMAIMGAIVGAWKKREVSATA